MLNKRQADILALIWDAAGRVGLCAPKIADDIIRSAFPQTMIEAELEGADRIIRLGLISEVKRVLRTGKDAADGQIDLSEIAPEFEPIVRTLASKSYTVPSLGEYVSIAGLIETPELLDEARRFMREKGEQCLCEADKLDELYRAVIGGPPTRKRARAA